MTVSDKMCDRLCECDRVSEFVSVHQQRMRSIGSLVHSCTLCSSGPDLVVFGDLLFLELLNNNDEVFLLGAE